MILKCESCIESWIFPTFFDWLLFIPRPRPLKSVFSSISTKLSFKWLKLHWYNIQHKSINQTLKCWMLKLRMIECWVTKKNFYPCKGDIEVKELSTEFKNIWSMPMGICLQHYFLTLSSWKGVWHIIWTPFTPKYFAKFDQWDLRGRSI